MSSDNQQEEPVDDQAPQISKFDAVVNKITSIIKYTVITVLVLAALGLGGVVAFKYLTTDHRLNGSVSFQYLDDGAGYILTVTNEEQRSWETPTIIVNDKYKFRSINLEGKTYYDFDLTQFIADDGTRFLPKLAVPKKVRVESGWDNAEWAFN